jgi:hypothetical protein
MLRAASVSCSGEDSQAVGKDLGSELFEALGWGSVFFGAPVICIEPTCVGRGDDLCRFEIRDAKSWGAETDPWNGPTTDRRPDSPPV